MLVGNVIDARVFHSRKTMQIIQKWEYGRISEKQMVDDLVLMGYDREDITDALEEEECP
jgi:phage terminase large subunit GpA-like protein